jgi:hypothetical protein
MPVGTGYDACMPADLYNLGAISIWKDHGCPIKGVPGTELFPLVLPHIDQPVRVVYSGLNPSFVLSAVASYARHVECPLSYFEWSVDISESEIDSRLHRLQLFEAHARVHHRGYFSHFERFSSAIGVDHAQTTHIDVLPLRATRQVDLMRALHRLRAEANVQRFIAAQRSIYAEVLRSLSPEVVLIANASAARWLRADLGLTPDASRRTYSWTAAPNIKFFLSAQLSGGATDEFGRDRLVADVRAVLDGA